MKNIIQKAVHDHAVRAYDYSNAAITKAMTAEFGDPGDPNSKAYVLSTTPGIRRGNSVWDEATTQIFSGIVGEQSFSKFTKYDASLRRKVNHEDAVQSTALLLQNFCFMEPEALEQKRRVINNEDKMPLAEQLAAMDQFVTVKPTEETIAMAQRIVGAVLKELGTQEKPGRGG